MGRKSNCNSVLNLALFFASPCMWGDAEAIFTKVGRYAAAPLCVSVRMEACGCTKWREAVMEPHHGA